MDPPKEYNIVNRRNCSVFTINPPMFPMFSWVKDASNMGACKANFVEGIKWVRLINGINYILCSNGNTPLYLEVHDNPKQQNSLLLFETFHPKKPDSRIFDVPSQCPK